MKLELEKDDLQSIAREVAALLTPLLSGKEAAQAAEDAIFDVPSLAQYLHTSSKWIYAHVHELPHFKKGGLLRFRKSAVDMLFNENPSKRPG